MATTAFSRRRPMARCDATRHRRSVTWTSALVGAVLAVALLGALMIFTATRGVKAPYDLSFLKKQIMFLVLGVGAMAGMATIDYRRIRDYGADRATSPRSCC